jgi:hypothetical protein
MPQPNTPISPNAPFIWHGGDYYPNNGLVRCGKKISA